MSDCLGQHFLEESCRGDDATQGPRLLLVSVPGGLAWGPGGPQSTILSPSQLLFHLPLGYIGALTSVLEYRITDREFWHLFYE